MEALKATTDTYIVPKKAYESPKKSNWLPYVLWTTIGLLGLFLSIYDSSVFLIAGSSLAISVVIFLYPKVGFGLLVPALFLEADVLSLNTPFGKVRFYHLITLVLFARLVFDLLRGRTKWRKSILDLPLIVYLAVNALTILWAPDKFIAFKIMGLLGLLSIMYWTIYNYADNFKKIKALTSLFLGSAVITGLIGLYQIATVALNKLLAWNLWTGRIMHSDILPFGRPYGTFVEPDWFGTFMMLALVVAATFFLAKLYQKKQISNLLLTLFFFLVVMLSAVRGAWLGLVAAGLTLVWLNKRQAKKLLSFRILFPAALGIMIILAGIVFIFPDLTSALLERIGGVLSFGALSGEPRLITMQSGWQIFLRSPWHGFGPGAFKTLGAVPFASRWQALLQGLEAFQTNAVLTVLIDTGVAGLLVVFWAVSRFIKRTRLALKAIKNQIKNKKIAPAARKHQKNILIYWLAWLAALVGLLIAYQITAGLWLGLSWFVLAVNIALLARLENLAFNNYANTASAFVTRKKITQPINKDA